MFQTQTPLLAFVLHYSSIVYELHGPRAIHPGAARLFVALTVQLGSTAAHSASVSNEVVVSILPQFKSTQVLLFGFQKHVPPVVLNLH